MWKRIFQICHWSIRDNTYKWFQLRILYRILGTRSYLSKVNISEDARCFRCRNEMENIIHMLVLCPKVKEFWNQILEYIKSKVTTTLLLTPFNIILGYTLAEVNQQPINTILLVAKKYIFEASNKCQNLNINGFIHRLHQVYSEQKLLYQLCHKEIYFNKIWKRWQPLIGYLI